MCHAPQPFVHISSLVSCRRCGVVRTSRRRGRAHGRTFPSSQVGHLIQDWDVFIAEGDITRCVGDAICLVVAKDEGRLSGREACEGQRMGLEPVRGASQRPRLRGGHRSSTAPCLWQDRPQCDNVCPEACDTRGCSGAGTLHHVVTNRSGAFTEHAFWSPSAPPAFPTARTASNLSAPTRGLRHAQGGCPHVGLG